MTMEKWSREKRPGWTNIAELVSYLTEHARFNKDQRRAVRGTTVVDGRLRLRVDDPPDEVRGMLAAAEALSAETCERCGGKGDPRADAAGERTGCRCSACSEPNTVRLPREWAPATVLDEPEAVSPGQWTTDLRGGMTGNEWDHDNWRHYGRLETLYAGAVEQLLQAEEDEAAMRLWAVGPGWAGLVRALMLTLRPEQDERPGDPRHTPWRLRWMKEKGGRLTVRTSPMTPYQRGAVWLFELISGWVCERCGKPGEQRLVGWGRTECDTCWATARPEDRERDRETRARYPAGADHEDPGRYRDAYIRW